MLYRNIGHSDENGNFVPPLSYTEAQAMPKRQIEMFIFFDDLADRMFRQINKKKLKGLK